MLPAVMPDTSSPSTAVYGCRVCGRGPAAMIDLERNVGMIVLRTWHRYRGPLCREHGTDLAREWLIKTLVLGWWGVISFFFNIMAVVKDVQAWRTASRLPPPGSLVVTSAAPVERFGSMPPPTWGVAQLASVPAGAAAGAPAAFASQPPNQLSSQPRPNELSPTGSGGPAPQPPVPVPGSAAPDPTGGIAPPTLPPVRRRSPLRQFSGLIVIVVVAVIVVGLGFLFRDRVTGQAADLQVGDCFDIPADASASATVNDVLHHPCTDAHEGEVFAVLTYPGDSSAVYPTQDAFDAFAAAQCGPAFTSYTGLALSAPTNLEGSYLFPTPDGWTSNDDRKITCYLDDSTGQPLTQSMRSPCALAPRGPRSAACHTRT